MITLWHWHTEPLLIGTLLFVAWLYAMCIGPFRERIQVDCPFPSKEAFLFYAGLITVYLAVGSPLDAIGENFLLSAHMVQHHILQFVSPLLIVLGIPGWLADAAFRKIFGLKGLFKFLAHPLINGIIWTAFFTGWHYPPFYEAALTNKTLHILQHYTMFLPSFFMWWLFYNKSELVPPSSYGVQILYTVAVGIAQTPLFAWLVFANSVHYPTYEFAPRLVDISPFDDQVLSGLIMKVVGMGVGLAVLGVSFYNWYKSNESIEKRFKDTALRGKLRSQV